MPAMRGNKERNVRWLEIALFVQLYSTIWSVGLISETRESLPPALMGLATCLILLAGWTKLQRGQRGNR